MLLWITREELKEFYIRCDHLCIIYTPLTPKGKLFHKHYLKLLPSYKLISDFCHFKLSKNESTTISLLEPPVKASLQVLWIGFKVYCKVTLPCCTPGSYLFPVQLTWGIFSRSHTSFCWNHTVEPKQKIHFY